MDACWWNPPRALRLSLTLGQAAIRQYCSLFFLLAPSLLVAATIEVTPLSLQNALVSAQPGDVLLLQNGIYTGPVTIDRSVTLQGSHETIIDGGEQHSTLIIDAPDVTVRNLLIRNSGISLAEEHSGIYITDRGDRAVIQNNRLQHNLIGVNLKGPEDVQVIGNQITGRQDLRMNERGNGVQIWNSPGSVVQGNQFQYGRDGIFVTTSTHNQFLNNQFTDLRFAIHYMYTHDSVVSGNRSIGNHIGYALMYSSRLTVTDNHSSRDRDRGLLFNFTNYSEIRGNRVLGYPEKCVFIYNSNYNAIHENRFEACQIGIHFTAGSEQNQIWNNAFVDNRTQVKYVGTRLLEWSHQGVGNYWSDHTAFDLNGDQIADKPYRPNSLTDQILWRHPMGKILINSPVFQLINWSQSQFPGLHPGGVIDSAPAMRPKI